MSMRGNGIHVSRATVQHELIPGHHLQGFMSERYNTHRNLFGTPFMGEGWSLYWEFLLWDQGFPRSPEDRDWHALLAHAPRARASSSRSTSISADGRPSSVSTSWSTAWATTLHGRRGGAAVVRRQLLAALSGGLHAGRLQIRSLSKDLVDTKKMTLQAVQRHDPQGEQHADRDAARR